VGEVASVGRGGGADGAVGRPSSEVVTVVGDSPGGFFLSILK
jgi:hypothetical protein